MSRPILDPDADGKQWKYRDFYIIDQRAYNANGIPAYCIEPMYGGSTYHASSVKDAVRTIDRLLERVGSHKPERK